MSNQSIRSSSSISLNLKHEPGKAAEELERMLESSEASSNHAVETADPENRDYVVVNDLSHDIRKLRAEENESFVLNEDTDDEDDEGEEELDSFDQDAEKRAFRRPPSLINTDDLLKDSQDFLGAPKVQPRRKKGKISW